MSTDKKHLDIDLGFLDVKGVSTTAPMHEKPIPPISSNGPPIGSFPAIQTSVGKKNNWLNILLITGSILVVLYWIITASGENSPSSTSPANPSQVPTSNTASNITNGNGVTYSCSGYNLDRANDLEPNASTIASLKSESAQLDARTSSLKAMGDEIRAQQVDESDQSSIDSYNTAVDEYNNKRSSLSADIADWNRRNDAINTQIDTYNSYLDSNCTLQ